MEPYPGQPNFAKICLAMVVRNEEQFIVNALESVAPYIHYWVILDSHSTDETEYLAKTYMGGTGVPGVFLQYNGEARGDAKRTECMNCARYYCTNAPVDIDYILMIDADNTLHITGAGDPFTDLTADSYFITKKSGPIDYPVLQLFSNKMLWKFVGVIHEYPVPDDEREFTRVQLPGCYVDEPVKTEGPRARTPRHYYNHALILERELYDNDTTLTDELRHRYMFYLGQSWKDAGFIDRAIDAYTCRIKMGGWDQEIWYSYYMIALLEKKVPDLQLALRAWNYRPQRRETALHLMMLLESKYMDYAAYIVGLTTNSLPCTDQLFIDTNMATLFDYELGELKKRFEL